MRCASRFPSQYLVRSGGSRGGRFVKLPEDVVEEMVVEEMEAVVMEAVVEVDMASDPTEHEHL